MHKMIGLYTDEQAGQLLDMPADTIRQAATQLGFQGRYLTAEILEKVWVKLRPFCVVARLQGRQYEKEDGRRVTQMILDSGGIQSLHMAQLRFPSEQEAREACTRMPKHPHYAWEVQEIGLDTAWSHLKAA